ncbi:Phenylacetic acid catabolic protein [Halovulum sp. GXIMD14793]
MTNDPDTMPMADYLAQGGKLTSPENAPPRYRAELMRLMSSFVDSELAGSAGFADAVNWAPGIRERIAASRIVLEKAAHAEKVLDLMGDFGTDTARYNQAHDWAARAPREAKVMPQRQGGDMRLSVFHAPLTGWADACVLNALMGLATGIQLEEMAKVSYTPLAEVMREIAPVEQLHMELGCEGLERLIGAAVGKAEVQASVAYWLPRVAETFGAAASDRFDRLSQLGLRHTPNEELRADWQAAADRCLAALKLA